MPQSKQAKYQVIYRNGSNEVLGTDMVYQEAQECARVHGQDMGEENAADILIKEEQ